MDTGFDMNTVFSPAMSRSNIWMMLSSVKMEKYVDQLIQKGVDFHTFANMTRDDLRSVGITNHKDQDCLMTITKSMSRMYEELNPKPVKWNKVVSNLHEQITILAASLVSLLQKLNEMPVEHSLVDQNTPSTEAMYRLLALIDSRAVFIQSDVQQIEKRYRRKADQERLLARKKTLIISAILVGAAVGGCVLLFKHKMSR